MLARGIVLGIVLSLVLAGVAGAVAVVTGLIPANADATPPAWEKLIARTSLKAAILRETSRTAPNPIPVTDENLDAGIKLYGTHCAVCHGAADGKASAIAQGLYQHAPQLAKHGVENDPPAVVYWKISHGIRLTGMPAFVQSLTENQLWQVTLFLQQMDNLPPEPKQRWEAMPSAAG